MYSAFIPLQPSNSDTLLLSLVCTFFLSYLTKQGTWISFLKIHWRNVYGTLSSINNKRLTTLLHSTDHFSLDIFHYFGLLLQTGNGKASLTNRTGNSSNTNYTIRSIKSSVDHVTNDPSLSQCCECSLPYLYCNKCSESNATYCCTPLHNFPPQLGIYA